VVCGWWDLSVGDRHSVCWWVVHVWQRIIAGCGRHWCRPYSSSSSSSTGHNNKSSFSSHVSNTRTGDDCVVVVEQAASQLPVVSYRHGNQLNEAGHVIPTRRLQVIEKTTWLALPCHSAKPRPCVLRRPGQQISSVHSWAEPVNADLLPVWTGSTVTSWRGTESRHIAVFVLSSSSVCCDFHIQVRICYYVVNIYNLVSFYVNVWSICVDCGHWQLRNCWNCQQRSCKVIGDRVVR